MPAIIVLYGPSPLLANRGHGGCAFVLALSALLFLQSPHPVYAEGGDASNSAVQPTDDGGFRLFGKRFGIGMGAGISIPASSSAKGVFGSARWGLRVRLIPPPQHRPLRFVVRLATRKVDRGTNGSALVIAPTAGVSFRLPSTVDAIAPTFHLRTGPYFVAATGERIRLTPGVDMELRVSLGRLLALSGGYQLVRRTNGANWSSWSLDATVRVY